MLIKHSKPEHVASLRDEVAALKYEVSILSNSTNRNPKICCHEGNASPGHTSSSSKINATDVQVLGKLISQNIDNGGRSVEQGLTERKFNLVLFGIPESPAGNCLSYQA